MTILEIAKMGNPVLRSVANPVDLRDLVVVNGDIQILIDDMIDTLRSARPTGAGLAAPQVMRPLRIVVVEVRANPRSPERPLTPLTILINPVITAYGQEQVSGWERCYSLPGLRGWVPRSSEVTVEAFDRTGEKFTMHGDGFLAKVLQHEIDHLNGILYPDRISDFTRFMYEEEFTAHWDEMQIKSTGD